jgi:aryl-alcohol dehydrogenase-like predicted oxidoreductase
VEFRQLGRSGLQVPVLSLGTGTFGGGTEFFKHWGDTDATGARRLIDMAMDAGVVMFDSADVYSAGLAESVLGKAIEGRRDKVLISTKGTFRTGPGPNEIGSSRHRIIAACEASLRRLGTDYIDLYQMHGFDAVTPIEETVRALDDLVTAGKVRYLGVSNFSGWQLMKSLAVADRYGWTRYVAHQAYYSLIGRDYEWELMPLGQAEGVGAAVWSPLGWGRLTGKLRRHQPTPEGVRILNTREAAPPVGDDYLFGVVDVLDAISEEIGRTIPQIALNWLLQRPTVATVLVGARNEAQLRENLGAIGWQLTADQVARLDAVSAVTPAYPHWHQRRTMGSRNPLIV